MGFRTRFTRRMTFGLLVGLAVVVGAAACGDDDDDDADDDNSNGGTVEATMDDARTDDTQEVEDIVTQAIESSGANADFFFDHVTDNLIETVLFSTREECEANADECIGEPGSVQAIADAAIDGDTATANVTADFGAFAVGLVREDDVWKVDSLDALSDEVADGTTLVDLTLAEFAFVFDDVALPADGNVAFRVMNEGEQAHEVVIVEIPADIPIEEALDSLAGDAEPAGLKLFVRPGQEVNMAFESPLEPGRYAMLCFFPDTDDPAFTPHIEKGMLAEFTVG